MYGPTCIFWANLTAFSPQGKNHVNDCPPPPDKQHATSTFLSALHRESVLHGAFAWVRRARNRPKRRAAASPRAGSLVGVAGLPADGKLDLTKLGLGETSMRVRTGRNLKAFPLPVRGAVAASSRRGSAHPVAASQGGMSQQQRCDMENVMCTQNH